MYFIYVVFVVVVVVVVVVVNYMRVYKQFGKGDIQYEPRHVISTNVAFWQV